jgi:hypothetical protein
MHGMTIKPFWSSSSQLNYIETEITVGNAI